MASKSKQRTKRQHITPSSYLAGFTNGGKQTDDLFRLDKVNGDIKQFTPESTGFERYFYLLEGKPGYRANFQAVEDFLEKWVEGASMPVLASIGDTRLLPRPETRDYGKLMSFMAASYVRGYIGLNLATEVADRMRSEAEAEGIKVTKDIKLKVMIQSIPELTLKLARYRWQLVERLIGTPDFITSDMPLACVWGPGFEKTEMPHFGDVGNALIFPINRRLVVYGFSVGDFRVPHLDQAAVETVNAWVAFYGHQYVYSSSTEIAAKFPWESVGGVEGILQAHGRRRLNYDWPDEKPGA
jgi:hypothetical protein